MSPAGIARNLRLLARHPSVYLGHRGYVLILSHMRSYSTLLAHLLGSHPEIAGYAEAHIAYRRRLDLYRLRSEVADSLDGPLKGRLLLDKLLHNHLSVSPTVLESPTVYPIFLVRRSAETLRSIMEMNERLPGMTPYQSEEAATAYYVDRLAELERLGRERQGNAFVLRSEKLLADPEPTLAQLGRFLRLDTPIETTYSTFPLTGVAGKGDYSDAIREGRILPPVDDTGRVAPSPAALDLAERAYTGCLETLEGLFGATGVENDLQQGV